MGKLERAFLVALAAAAAVFMAGCPDPTDRDVFSSIGLDVPSTHTFGAIRPGYAHGDVAPLTVTVTNTGDNPTGRLEVALSGPGGASFGLSRPAIPSMGAAGNNTFLVFPVHDLGVGRHTATVTVSGGNVDPLYFDVTFVVNVARLIPHDQARQMMRDLDDVIVLDVRRQDEFDEGHVAGAVLLPYTELADRAAEVLPNKDQVILIYCRAGRRSMIAADELIEMGYLNVYDFGGLLVPPAPPTPPTPWPWEPWPADELVRN